MILMKSLLACSICFRDQYLRRRAGWNAPKRQENADQGDITTSISAITTNTISTYDVVLGETRQSAKKTLTKVRLDRSMPSYLAI